MEEVKERALKIMDKKDVGVLATIADNKPVARYMSFYSEGFNLYTITDKRTEKVEDIQNNPHVFVLLGHEEGMFDKDYVEIEGTVSTSTDQEIIDKAWNKYTDKHYSSKDDPNILVLKIEASKVNLKNRTGSEIQEIIV